MHPITRRAAIARAKSPENTTLKTFKELGIPVNLMQGLQELGIINPTEIQDKAIPFLLEDGGDLIAQAQTGTAKPRLSGCPC